MWWGSISARSLLTVLMSWVVFHSLTRDQIEGIASIQIQRLNKRLAEDDLSLTLSDEAMKNGPQSGLIRFTALAH